MRVSALVAATVAAIVLGSCGGGGGGPQSGDSDSAAFKRAIADAQSVTASNFPAPEGRTLQQMANPLAPINIGLATSVYTPGENRVAFGLIDQARKFVYGKTAIYLARSPNDKPRGPFPAPVDPLVVKPPFRSRGAALETGGIAAIYTTNVKLPRAGRWYVLAVTNVGGRFYGGATRIDVKRSSPIPPVGERPPAISTDTVTSAGGNVKSIDTRVPPDDMHDTNFKDVLGKKPVALLFATPALCQSRVCGPVVDVGAQLKSEYGDKVEFIHEEVYVDNTIAKGYRPQLRAFHLRSEPWLFTFDRQGRVAARLEGSFGLNGFEQAIKAALR